MGFAVVGVADRRPVVGVQGCDCPVDGGVAGDGDQEPGVELGELVDHVPAEQPRVSAHRQRSFGRQAARPGDRLGDEAPGLSFSLCKGGGLRQLLR